jgi:hypothetical protein
MAIVLGWIIFAVIVGVAASARGRNGFGFFLLSLMLSPLIGILFVMAMPNLKHESLLKQIADRTPAPIHFSPRQRRKSGSAAGQIALPLIGRRSHLNPMAFLLAYRTA